MSDKKIVDYLHLYLGCECIETASDGIDYSPTKLSLWTIGEVIRETGKFKTVKLVLRPLNDAQGKIIQVIADKVGANKTVIYNLTLGLIEYLSLESASIILNEFRKEGFDCDGLIEAGLAIDKN